MFRRSLLATAVLGACLLAGALSPRDGLAAAPKVFVVDTTSPSSVLNGCDPAVEFDCSLTGAINDANSSPNSILGPDAIHFGVLTGYATIYVGAAGLPQITDPVDIDASTQPPGVENCGPGATPCVHVDGAATGASLGFFVDSSGVSIRGFSITGFHTGIYVNNGSNIVIAGNYIGTYDGATAAPNLDGGITVHGSNVRIGGTTPEDRNLISGNSENSAQGIVSTGDNITIEGNYVGVNAAGTAALKNGGGINIAGTGVNVTVGGADPGAGNVISGNDFAGLQMNVPTFVYGNLIGTDATGMNAIPNGIGINFYEADGSTIGGTAPGQRNVISGNNAGVSVDFAKSTQIVGNYIGLNKLGTGKVPNGAGIYIVTTGASRNIDDTVIAHNVISGNNYGVIIASGAAASEINRTAVTDNIIGLNAAGTQAVPNRSGVALSSQDGVVQDTMIGQVGHPNVISGNVDGIVIIGATVTGTTITGNLIGTGADARPR